MGATTVDKRSISLPPEVAQGVDERVGKGGFSAYAAAAIARQLRLDALDEAIERMEAAHGPVDPARVEELMQRHGRR
jgi:Arc/MetJ-type ribon-helix-helix transcriptional regulator